MDSFNLFANAVGTCHNQAALFTKVLLSQYDQKSLVYWIFNYYTVHYENDAPTPGIVDSYFDTKQIEWVQSIFNAKFVSDTVYIKSDKNPLQDNAQCIYLILLLCQGKNWDDPTIHETWRVLYEGNQLLQINENGEQVGNPCRAIHQRVVRKMTYMTSNPFAKSLLSIFSNDFTAATEYVDTFLMSLFVYLYMERELNRNDILNKQKTQFGGAYEMFELPSIEEFLDNLKCSNINTVRNEANDPIYMLLSAVITSSELTLIEKLCTRQVVSQNKSTPFDFTDFSEEVVLIMVHLVLIFQFEDMQDMFQLDWVKSLFSHFLDLLCQYEHFAFIPIYHHYALIDTKEIAYYFSKLNYAGVSLDAYRTQVSNVQINLTNYGYDVESVSLQVLHLYLLELAVGFPNIGYLNVLEWANKSTTFLIYYDLLYRYLLINKYFDAIEVLESMYASRISIKTLHGEEYLEDIDMCLVMFKILHSNKSLAEKKVLFEVLMDNYRWDLILDYGVDLDLDLGNIMMELLEVVAQPDEHMDGLKTARFVSTQLTKKRLEHVRLEQAHFVIDNLLTTLLTK